MSRSSAVSAMSVREVFTRVERKAIAADILRASEVKAGSIAASLGLGSAMLSRWKSPDYGEAPSFDDLALLDMAAQTTILRERMCEWYGTPDRSQTMMRVLRINAQLAAALEEGDTGFIDRLQAAMSEAAT